MSKAGYSVVPNCTNAVRISFSASSNAFQQAIFPLQEKLPVILAPLKAWNAARATDLIGPNA